MTSKSGHIQVKAVSADSVLLLDVLRGVLDRCGGQRWLVRLDQAWCSVSSPTGVSRKHGWKVHVSATPLSAPLVLARAAEVLVRHGCSFKFGTDIACVLQLVSPPQDRGAAASSSRCIRETTSRSRVFGGGTRPRKAQDDLPRKRQLEVRRPK
jgi:hypothetical protein